MPSDAFPLRLQRENRELAAWLAYATSDCLESLKAALPDFLAAVELDYYKTLVYPKRSEQYLLSRYAAKRAAARCLHEDRLSEIRVAQGVFSQPILQYAALVVPEVSFSHCASGAVAVVSPPGHPLTVDLEAVNRENESALRNALDPAEAASIQSLGIPPERALLVLWTAKEALSKALRCGLTLSLDRMRMASAIRTENCFEIQFADFVQYKALSYPLKDHVLTFVLPRKSELNLDPSGWPF